MKTKYWTGVDELENTPAFQESINTEFQRDQSVDEFLSDPKLKETSTARRDFLKFMGFGLGAATLAACETPVVKSIPYVNKPEDITPGVPNWYASTYYDGQDYGNILVKTREGRPIYLKGNKDLGWEGGAINSRINASVLALYDSARAKGPSKAGTAMEWTQLDTEVKAALSSARSVKILSNTIVSPSTTNAINAFIAKYGADKVSHIQYDAYSYQGITAANQAQFGKAAVPQYHFDQARTIVSIAADFLGTWLTSNIYAAQYGQMRKPESGEITRHYQFEAVMSMTGTNADVRVPIKPSQEGIVAAGLLAAVNGSAPGAGELDASIQRAAADLKKNAGRSLVVAGSNDANVQMIVNAINEALGNYGHTVDIEQPISLFRGDDTKVEALVNDMNAGSVDVLIIYGCNPAYTWYNEKFSEGLAKVKTSICFNLYMDETAARCTYLAPDHHYLESWNDYSPVAGRVDLAQPAISPMYNSRQAQENFLRWADDATSYYDFLRKTYTSGYLPAMMKSDSTWNMAVHNGTMSAVPSVMPVAAVADSTATPAVAPVPAMPVVAAAPAALNVADAISKVKSAKGGQWELALYQKVTMGAGQHAANPFLQETPDPVTKVTWDNYVTMSPADVAEAGLNKHLAHREKASVIKVTANGREMILPVFPAPGQKRGTIGIALGYGRGANGEMIGNAAYQTGEKGVHLDETGAELEEGGKPMTIGKNAFPLASMGASGVVYAAMDVTFENTGDEYSLACTQMHHTVMGRESVVRETTIATYLTEKDKKRGEASFNMAHTLPVHEDVNGDGEIDTRDRKNIREFDLWAEHPVEGVGFRWGLTIDLSSCIGCGSCITACHTENNVPVVGKDEVLRHRDMHWMRIDRYFSSTHTTLAETQAAENMGTIAAYRNMEDPAENPMTVHMPMMCQHCNHAPCETVCPVAATVHSNEGLNNMAYNRCIGTRYCANNCPYKVRRFNWFNYVTNDKFSMVNPAQDDTMRMVLNPDVTVRTRGVMEKCSMCQQRIQGGKTAAKLAGKPVKDGAIQTACAEACPTNAIIFGDLNDKESLNRKRADNVRSYHSLEETGAQPNVFYMTKVRNTEEEVA